MMDPCLPGCTNCRAIYLFVSIFFLCELLYIRCIATMAGRVTDCGGIQCEGEGFSADEQGQSSLCNLENDLSASERMSRGRHLDKQATS